MTDSSGEIRLKNKLDYETQQNYKLFVRAQNTDGFSKYTAIYVEVQNVEDAPYAVSFKFETAYADIAVGSKVGEIVFASGTSKITYMGLIGEDSAYFKINTNGIITTSRAFEDFFVKKVYLFDVVAANASGKVCQ